MDFDDTQIPFRLSFPEQARSFMVYPNPAKNSFTVYYQLKDDEFAYLYLSDPLGCNVEKLQLKTNEITHSYSINNLSDGIYIVKFVSDSGTALTSKLIIIK